MFSHRQDASGQVPPQWSVQAGLPCQNTSHQMSASTKRTKRKNCSKQMEKFWDVIRIQMIQMSIYLYWRPATLSISTKINKGSGMFGEALFILTPRLSNQNEHVSWWKPVSVIPQLSQALLAKLSFWILLNCCCSDLKQQYWYNPAKSYSEINAKC